MKKEFGKRMAFVVLSLVAVASLSAIVGCARNMEEANGECEIEAYPMNFLEERTQKYDFDSYEEIISLLEDGEAYGYADVMGTNEKVLFITNETFDGYGYPASICCFPYTKAENGKYRCDSILSSASTSTPVSVTEDGRILTATHDEISVMAYGKETSSLMCVEYAYVDRGEDGNTNTYGGFVRESNSFESPEKEIASDDSSVFEEAFSLFDSAEPISFTVK